MSPLLFSLFINDLSFTEHGIGVKLKSLEGSEVFLSDVLYADDLALLAVQEAQIQSMLDFLKQCADRKDLIVNVSKCRVMCFNQGRTPVHVNLRYNDVRLSNLMIVTWV